MRYAYARTVLTPGPFTVVQVFMTPLVTFLSEVQACRLLSGIPIHYIRVGLAAACHPPGAVVLT